MINIIAQHHPLYFDQDIHTYEYNPSFGDSICDVLENAEVGVVPHQLYTMVHNGYVVPRNEWDIVVVNEGDELILKATVGDGETSRTVGYVVVAIAAAVASWGASTAVTAAGYSAAAAAAAGAAAGIAVSMGGSLILNAIVPPVLPKFAQPKTDNVSPIYSLTQAGNRIRPYEPMMVIFGRHKIFPDTDAFPYSRIGPDGDFYLYQSFSLGVGPISTVSNIQIGETAIGSYDNVDYELSGSDGIITLFPTNVTETSLGYDMKYSSGYQQATTTINCVRFTWTFQGQVFAVNEDNGDTIYNQVIFTGQYREVGSGTWLDLIDDQNTWYSGLYTGGFTLFGSASKDVIRRTFTKTVPQGQYEIRIKRETFDHTESTKFSYWTWTDIDSQEYDSNDYTGQYRMGLRVKASEVSNGQLDQINMVVSSETDVYDGGWVVEETSNPAWWYLKAARGVYDNTGRRMWGLGLDDTDINIDNIIEWAAFCDTNNLEFNYVLDSREDAPTVMSLIAKVGRAAIAYPEGKLGVIFDEEKALPTQKFTMSNIIADTFTLEYESQKAPDEIVGTFINEDTWKPDIVRVNVPGVSSPSNQVEYQLYGVTNETQAGAEINLLAASQVYHRRNFVWEAQSEAIVCTKGDRVDLAHDLLGMVSRRLLSPSNNTTLTVDGDVNMDEFTTPYVQVRSPDGTIETKPTSTTGITDTIVLDSALSFNPSSDTQNEEIDYICSIGSSSAPYVPVKIVSIEPLDEQAHRFKIGAREEVAAYYAAASDSYNYTAPGFYNRQVPQVINIDVQEQWLGNPGVRLYLSYELIQSVGVEIRSRLAGTLTWVNHGTIYGSTFNLTIPHPLPSGITFELTPLSIRGTKTTNTTVQYAYDIVGFTNVPDFAKKVPNVSGLQLVDSVTSNTFATRDAKFAWRAVGDTDLDRSAELGEQYGQVVGYEIRIIDPDGTVVRKDFSQTNYYTYSWENNYDDHQGDVERAFSASVFAVGQFGQLSKKAATLSVSNPAPTAPAASVRGGVDQFFVDIDELNYPDIAGYYVFADPSSGFTPSSSNVVYKGPDTIAIFDNQGVASQYVVVAAFDSFSDDIADLNLSTEYVATSIGIDELISYQFAGIIFEPTRIAGSPEDGSPGGYFTNDLTWTAGTASSGETTYIINSGSVNHSPGTTLYVYFDPSAATGSPQTVDLQTTTALSTAVSGTILGTYEGGSDFIGANGDAFIDGNRILARTIGATRLVANEAVITGETQMGAATINTAAIKDLNVIDAHILSLTGNKITTNSLNANRIITGTIDATRMAANSITAANGAIADLTVSTLKVAGNNITVPTAAYTASPSVSVGAPHVAIIGVGGSYDPYNLGSKVIISISISSYVGSGWGARNLFWRIHRIRYSSYPTVYDHAYFISGIWTSTDFDPSVGTPAPMYNFLSYTYVDIPYNLYTEYWFEAFVNSGTGISFSNASISAIGAQR